MQTFSGLTLAFAISVMGRAEVFDAKMHSGEINCNTTHIWSAKFRILDDVTNLLDFLDDSVFDLDVFKHSFDDQLLLFEVVVRQ